MTKTVSTRLVEQYQIRREVSQPADLITLLLARLKYDGTSRQTEPLRRLASGLQSGQLQGVSGDADKIQAFTRWLYDYLVINDTVRGISFYPIHPALSLFNNGEGSRVDAFVHSLAQQFTLEERNSLVERLWSAERMPPFERMIFELVDWQPVTAEITASEGTNLDLSAGTEEATTLTPTGILQQTKRDLLALSEVMNSVQSFVSHGGRLMAFAISRFILAQTEQPFEIPLYTAPAADSHDGVKSLAHEIIEMHQARLERSLEKQFRDAFDASLLEAGWRTGEDPEDEKTARAIVRELFHSRANVIPRDYNEMRRDFGSLANMAYHYYWSQSYARSRFLRQLHAAYLNLAKKAGFANSRSRYSRWHFYWLAPSLVETLLLVTQARHTEPRILVTDLLDDWHARYGIAVLITAAWDDIYRRYFRSFGNPETLNEANERRFIEILAERGRLHKNSDDFPWVILRD